jgi:hypothetical protein
MRSGEENAGQRSEEKALADAKRNFFYFTRITIETHEYYRLGIIIIMRKKKKKIKKKIIK